jgi:hypothetical protein
MGGAGHAVFVPVVVRLMSGVVVRAPATQHRFFVDVRHHRTGRRALNNPLELTAVEPNATTFGTPVNFHSLPVRRDQIYSGTNGTFPGFYGFGFCIQLFLLDQYFY